MKTSEEIIARYLSEDSADFFNAQRAALICMVPFEQAKPYLDPEYVKAEEDGTLPEDEKWIEDFDVKKQIIDTIKMLEEGAKIGDSMFIMEGLLYIKGWIWATDEKFHDEIQHHFEGDFLDMGRDIIKDISKHYNIESTIEDVDFEEVEDKKE